MSGRFPYEIRGELLSLHILKMTVGLPHCAEMIYMVCPHEQETS